MHSNQQFNLSKFNGIPGIAIFFIFLNKIEGEDFLKILFEKSYSSFVENKCVAKQA